MSLDESQNVKVTRKNCGVQKSMHVLFGTNIKCVIVMQTPVTIDIEDLRNSTAIEKEAILTLLSDQSSSRVKPVADAVSQAVLSDEAIIPALVSFIKSAEGHMLVNKIYRLLLNTCAMTDSDLASRRCVDADIIRVTVSMYPHFVKNDAWDVVDKALHLFANIAGDNDTLWLNNSQMTDVTQFTCDAVRDGLAKCEGRHMKQSLLFSANFALQNICRNFALSIYETQIVSILDSLKQLMTHYSPIAPTDDIETILWSLDYLYRRDRDETETTAIVKYSDECGLLADAIGFTTNITQQKLRTRALETLEKISCHKKEITKYLTQHGSFFDNVNLILRDVNQKANWPKIAWIASNLILDGPLIENPVVVKGTLKELMRKLKIDGLSTEFVKEISVVIENTLHGYSSQKIEKCETCRMLVVDLIESIQLMLSKHYVLMQQALNSLKQLLNKFKGSDRNRAVLQVAHSYGIHKQLYKLVRECPEIFPDAKVLLETHFPTYLASKLDDSHESHEHQESRESRHLHIHIHIDRTLLSTSDSNM